MNVFESVVERVEVRSYLATPVPPEIVRDILEAGRLSPSAMNRQPWKFIVVKDRETLKKIGSLSPSGSYLAEAAFAIAIAAEPENQWYQIDTARAAQNMMLVAWSRGVGSCWVGNIKRDEVKKLLAIPDKTHLVTILPFGYPKHPRRRTNKNRKPLSEIAHLERYGRIFPAD